MGTALVAWDLHCRSGQSDRTAGELGSRRTGPCQDIVLEIVRLADLRRVVQRHHRELAERFLFNNSHYTGYKPELLNLASFNLEN